MNFWLGGELGSGGSLVWTAPQWMVLCAVAATILVWVVSLFGDRPQRIKIVDSALFGLALLALIIAAARPVWLEEEGRTEPGRLAVLVDGSSSMSTREEGVERSIEALAILERLQGPNVDVYTFGNDMLLGAPSEFTLSGTDIEGALFSLRERVAGEKLAGVVLISDGIDRGLLRRRFREDGEDALPPELAGPLTVYGVGSDVGLVDLSVRSIDSGGFAFLRNDFTLTAEIDGLGFAGRTVPASLLRNGAVVTEQPVTLDDQGRAGVSFTIRPDAAGRFSYAVTVPVFEGDAVPANNSLPVVVRVVRDRIRVLQVAGSPSWDVKFLRRFLKGDPSVDLVSFFILRTHQDVGASYADRELSLIEFPYQDLFSTDLNDFDLVVLQNFDPEPYFRSENDRLLGNIRDYVAENGHALVMVGGEKSFDNGGYRGSPIEGILPVRLGVAGDPVDEGSFAPALTEDGARHPITRLVPDMAENSIWWDRLPELPGTNRVVGAHNDATVLLEHPTLRGADGSPMPVLAVREAGRGRTMALTIDASWQWSFDEAAEGRGNQAYLRFWKNSFHWLMADPSSQRVTVDTPKENYRQGDTVRIIVRARDTGFEALADAPVTVTVTNGPTVVERTYTTDRDGEYVLELPADRNGAHQVDVTVGGPNEELSANTVYAVSARDPELDELKPDPAFLQWLAARTEGQFHASGDFAAPLRDAEAGRTVWDRQETPIWRAPILMAWALLFAGLAWLVRRRGGGR
jgi:uncharacterized membrane protein